MSERKTAEIKFRCTPSFKASVQAAAEAAGSSMSEYIEAAVQEKEWARLNQSFDGLRLTNNAAIRALLVPDEDEYLVESSLVVDDGGPNEAVISNVTTDCGCRPWEFCTHKGAE